MPLTPSFLAREGFARQSLARQNAAIFDAVNRQTQRIIGTLAGVSPGVLAAAGDYGALDIMSDSASAGNVWVFANAARFKGGNGRIRKMLVTTSVEGITSKFRLWLFHTALTTTAVNDNAAFNLTAADRDKVVGYIETLAAVDMGAINYAQSIGLDMEFSLPDGETDLYGVLVTVDAVSAETAGMTASVELQVEQY